MNPYRAPDVIPMYVEDTRGFQVGGNHQVAVGGYHYTIVGIDDAANILFVRPWPSTRRDRRAAIKQLIKPPRPRPSDPAPADTPQD